MLDEKKKWFLLNSGGGAQALAPPSFLWANGWSETRVDAGLVKVGADSYDFQISDDAGFSNIVAETLASVSELTTFTGLTPETDYYVRCRAKFGSVYSDWLTQSCYTLTTPLHAYDFRGLDYATTNVYGKTKATPPTTQVDEVYSYRGTANTLTPNSTAGALKAQNTDPTFNNKQSAYLVFNNVKSYKSAIPIDLGLNPFTVLFEAQHSNLHASVFKNFLGNSVDANTFMIYNRSSLRARFVAGSGGSYQQSFPFILDAYALVRMAVRRTISGSTATYFLGIMNQDDSISWSAGITDVNLKNNAIFDRLFIDESMSLPSMCNFYTKALTDTQIQREFKRVEQPTYTFKANTTHLPSGLTWSNELNSGWYENVNLGGSTTAGGSWINVWTLDGISNVRIKKDDALYTDLMKFFRHSDGFVSNDIELPPPTGAYVDSHNVCSLAPIDNTWYTFEMNAHYEAGATKIVVRRFGDNWNMVEYTELPRGNGIVSYMGSTIQYLQAIKTPTSVIITAHEFNSATGARWYTAYVFKDNFNSCKKVRIFDCTNTIGGWVYGLNVYGEDKIRLVIHYIPDAANPAGVLGGYGVKYRCSFYIESSDDFDNINNLMYGYNPGDAAAFSKAIGNGNPPLTPTDALAHFIMGPDGNLKSYSTKIQSCFYDPTDGKVYGVCLNGDNNGLLFVHSVNGVWVEVAIDLKGENIVCGHSPVDGVNHGSNAPQLWRTGPSSYELVAHKRESGTYPNEIWSAVKYSTTDSWATSSYDGVVEGNGTHKIHRLSATHNMHYTGGSNAYNGKRLLIMSKELTSPADHSYAKFLDIS